MKVPRDLIFSGLYRKRCEVPRRVRAREDFGKHVLETATFRVSDDGRVRGGRVWEESRVPGVRFWGWGLVSVALKLLYIQV